MFRLYRKGDKSLIKDLNRWIVMNHIRLNGPISRTEIAKDTHLGLSTITNIIDELIDQSYIHEIGTDCSSGGRKPILLEFNKKKGLIIGIKIEINQVIIGLSNFEAEILHKRSFKTNNYSNKELIEELIHQIEMIIKNNHSNQSVFGIGIATSGVVNPKEKVLEYSPILNWRNYSFKKLESYFNVPVIIDNDANVFTMAHLWSKVGKSYHNFIGVTIGQGVGSGIVLEGSLYRGTIGSAGEFGHIVIERNGRPCYCGQKGCLEMYVSDQYLIEKARKYQKEIVEQSYSSINFVDDIYMLAKKGNREIQNILFQQGKTIGIGIKNLNNLLNPEAIIIGGEGLRGLPYVKEGIFDELKSHFLSYYNNHLDIVISDLGDDVWLIGSCVLVLESLFKSPIYK